MAVGFLTAVPLPGRRGLRAGELGMAVAWFPVVGILVGLVGAGVDWAARAAWGDAHLAAACVLVAWLGLTGGLHVDGFMDTADAYFSHRDAQGMMEVMRDSRAGALGVAAGVALLLIKFAALAALAPGTRWAAITLAPGAARAGLALGIVRFPYARSQGMGAGFATEGRARHALLAIALAAGGAALLLGWWGLGALGTALTVAWLCGAYWRRRLGGVTGDVYGAMNEAAELAALLLLLGGQAR